MSAPTFLCDDSDREVWLEHRRTGTTGTDCPGILGISPFTTPAKIAAQKAGLLPQDAAETELMAWGRKVEPLLIETFLDDMQKAGKKGWQARTSGKLYRCTAEGQGFMLATIDGQAVDPAGRAGVIECKLKIFGASEWEQEGIPDYVIAQTQHNGEVVDAAFCLVIGLLDGYRPRWKVMERARDLLDETIIPAERDFWARYQAGEAFPLDKGRPEVNLDLVRRLHPDDNGELVKLEGPALLKAARDWKHQSGVRLAAEKLEKAAKAVVSGAIGDATYGVLDDGTQLSWKSQTKPAGTHKSSSSRVLRVDSEKTARKVQATRRRPGRGAGR